MSPPAEGLTSRLLGPALRTQPDRRLVTLIREGYEAAFEEVVRRYGRPLRRYAASIVGTHSEDVTQDAFSKAYQALRRDDSEIELRPWLYRIVRNTALNDLRGRPAQAEALAETIAGGQSTAEVAEQRAELAELIGRLRALPEPQRAAIVMRELEGLSHEEIAAALGISGGAARQTIHRARTALRNGAGMLLPLPLLRALIDHSGEALAAGAGAGMAAGAGGGAGVALKAGVVTAVLAGSVGTGLALKGNGNGHARDAGGSPAAAASTTTAPLAPASGADGTGSDRHAAGGAGREDGHGDGGRDEREPEAGDRDERSTDDESDRSGSGDGRHRESDSEAGSHSGPGGGTREGSDDDRSGPGGDGGEPSGESSPNSGSGSGDDSSSGDSGEPSLPDDSSGPDDGISGSSGSNSGSSDAGDDTRG